MEVFPESRESELKKNCGLSPVLCCFVRCSCPLFCTLLENSLSFFNESLAKAILSNKSPDQWKFAIIAIVQSIELLLKERLKNEHRLLVYKNVDVKKETVSMDVAIKRLEEINSDIFSAKDKKAIDSAKQLRNSIIHHEFTYNARQAESLFSVLIGFYSEFMRKNLGQELNDIVDRQSWERALSIKTHVGSLEQRAIDRVKKENISQERIVYCHRCSHSLFVLDEDGKIFMSGTCYLCGNTEHLEYCHVCAGLFQMDMLDWIDFEENGHSFHGYVCRPYCQSKF